MRSLQPGMASPRRLISLGAVGVLHVILIWALASGLAARLVQKQLEELKAEVVQEKAPDQPKEPPPPPPDLIKPPPPFVPPPDITIQSEAPSNAITQVQSQQAKPAISAPASVGRPHSCVQKYPPSAQRLGHQGSTGLTFQITAEGDVANVTVSKPSGYDELDQAAISCAQSWRYKPAIQNGQPIAVPWSTTVVWKLTGG